MTDGESMEEVDSFCHLPEDLWRPGQGRVVRMSICLRFKVDTHRIEETPTGTELQHDEDLGFGFECLIKPGDVGVPEGAHHVDLVKNPPLIRFCLPLDSHFYLRLHVPTPEHLARVSIAQVVFDFVMLPGVPYGVSLAILAATGDGDRCGVFLGVFIGSTIISHLLLPRSFIRDPHSLYKNALYLLQLVGKHGADKAALAIRHAFHELQSWLHPAFVHARAVKWRSEIRLEFNQQLHKA
mmetsp:Transcript_21873/g.38703  ORF Transcript_21873/g.38703 Transcript_21873/m.38703 type:complete len:239 (+) Transcript_21873:484-1200(+)